METIDDIVREMRKQGKYNKENIDLDWLTEEVGDFQLMIADRIEAAVKNQFRDTTKTMPEVAVAENATTTPTCKNSLQVGNAAAMRVALEEISNLADAIYTHNECANENSLAIFSICNAALSSPPRNCDVYATEADRQSAFINWYNEAFDLKGDQYAIDTCDLKHNIEDILHEYIDWLFAEAKGEAK